MGVCGGGAGWKLQGTRDFNLAGELFALPRKGRLATAAGNRKPGIALQPPKKSLVSTSWFARHERV